MPMRRLDDRWRGLGTLVTPNFGTTIPDVDRNDGGDDAAGGDAAGFTLRKGGTVASGSRLAVCFYGVLCCGLLYGLDNLQSGRSAGSMGLARSRIVVPSDDREYFPSCGSNICWGRCFPIFAS